METQSAHPPESAEAAPRSWSQRFVAELKSRPFAYGVLAAFLPAGPLIASWLFPEAPLSVAIVGGLLLAGYAALCAVPDKFL